MTGSLRDLLVHQIARLRLACEALGVEPEDVRLDDLTGDQRDRLIGLATLDLVDELGMRGGRAREARDAAPAAADAEMEARRARFRELAAVRRARDLKARVRASDVSDAPLHSAQRRAGA